MIQKIKKDLYPYYKKVLTYWYDLNYKEQIALKLARLKYEKKYQSEKEPLVSVTIPTWNRSKILTELCIPSILNQTYQNFEIMVVGDHCTDDTEQRLKKIKDKRIRFYNLPTPTVYPSDPYHRWRIGGTRPSNLALDMSRGSWISHLDDDEYYTPNHIELLLYKAIESGCEFVYGVHKQENSPGEWIITGSAPLSSGKVGRSSVFYRSYLRFFKYRDDTYKFNRPHDKDLWGRMARAKVRDGFVNEIVTIAPLRPGEGIKEARTWTVPVE